MVLKDERFFLIMMGIALSVAGLWGYVLFSLQPVSNPLVNAVLSSAPALLGFVCGVIWAEHEVNKQIERRGG